MRTLRTALAVLLLTSFSALAGSGWHKVAELDAGGDGKEVSVNRDCSVCLIKCEEGSVIINTVVIREGGKKTPKTVGKRLNKGDSEQVPFGDKINVTGLRIGDDGRGHYEVYVK